MADAREATEIRTGIPLKVFLPTTEDILGDGVSPVILSDPKQADAVERNLRFVPNQAIITSAHTQATNKMGSSEVNSVVSRDFVLSEAIPGVALLQPRPRSPAMFGRGRQAAHGFAMMGSSNVQH